MKLPTLVQSTFQKAQYLLGSKFADEMLSHAQNHHENLSRLRKAAEAGNKRAIRKHQGTILKSYSSKLVCLVRSVDKDANLTAEYLQKTAAELDPWHDPGESITAWAKRKTFGEGWRPVCEFGPKRTALQTLCADILMAKFGIDPVDFLSKGRGAEIASDHTVDLVEKHSFEYFVLADVKDFFRSVQQQSLPGITGLPEAVIKNCILIGGNTSIAHTGNLPIGLTLKAFDGAVRQGLPQGSRASQLIAGMLLGPVLRQVAPADRIVLYGDDSAIAASSEQEASAFEKALSGILKSHPAGPFRVKSLVVYVNDSFDFLKYRFRRDWVTGKMRRRPSNKSYARYSRNITKIVAGEPPLATVRSIARYRYHWMRSFLRWRWNSISKLLLWLTTLNAMDEGEKAKAAKGAKAISGVLGTPHGSTTPSAGN